MSRRNKHIKQRLGITREETNKALTGRATGRSCFRKRKKKKNEFVEKPT